MSSNLQCFGYLVVLLIFWLISGTYSSHIKNVLERFKYLETKITGDLKLRDEDFLGILENLNKIEDKLTYRFEFRKDHNRECDKIDANEYLHFMVNLNNAYSRIRKAFKEEKYQNERIRRQIPNLEHNITSIQQDLHKYCSTSLDNTKKVRLQVVEAAESVKSEIVEKIDKAKSSLQETLKESTLEAAESVKFDMVKKIEKAKSSLLNNFQESVLQLGNQSDRESIDVSIEIENVKLFVTDLTNKVDKILSLLLPESCLDLRNFGNIQNGVYKVRTQMKVYCDQVTDDGGWTVFQRRLNGAVDFYKSWNEYKAGFGDLNAEFWLGNEILSTLTSQDDHELRVEMEDFEGNKAFAKYSKFRIHTEDDLYRLEVSGYSGNAGDSLTYHNGMPFTTFDRDNDKDSSANCAKTYLGAWWYNNCHLSNLNGKYLNEAEKHFNQGNNINWYHWKDDLNSLKTVELKFR